VGWLPGWNGKGEKGRGRGGERGGRDRWGGWNGKGEKGKGRGRLERWGVGNVGLG
jgi:hypothetical protein